MEATVLQRLQNVFQDVFDDPDLEIDSGMTADDVDVWDSLSHINLILRAEKEFGIRFKNSQVARLQNVGEWVGLIASMLDK